jgi:hypothetical protein
MQLQMTDTAPVNTYKAFPVAQRDPVWVVTQVDALSDLEHKTGLTKLRKQHKQRKRSESMESLVRLWPVWIGALLACFAPDIYGLIAPLSPWAARVVFPLVALAGYHELQLGSIMSRLLPQILLYAQFPVEGLVAKIFLRQRVTFAGVAGQLLLFHFLGAVGLWLIRDALALNPIR